jgi:RND superfamily putative drug exporter
MSGSTREGRRVGVASTARLITGAALIIVAVFAASRWATCDVPADGLRRRGRALIDATIIRSVLLPATMRLLGRWNWYLPSWLEWLPRIQIEAGRREEAVPLPSS